MKKKEKIVFCAVIFFATMLLQLAFCCFWFSRIKQICAKSCPQCPPAAEMQLTAPDDAAQQNEDAVVSEISVAE